MKRVVKTLKLNNQFTGIKNVKNPTKHFILKDAKFDQAKDAVDICEKVIEIIQCN